MRTWTQPEAPTDAEGVRDRDGDLWRKQNGGQWINCGTGGDEWTVALDGDPSSWYEVMRYAPLREVTKAGEAMSRVGAINITDAAIQAVYAAESAGAQPREVIAVALYEPGFEVAE